MSELQLFFWGINAAIIFVVLFVVLIIALWGCQQMDFERKDQATV